MIFTNFKNNSFYISGDDFVLGGGGVFSPSCFQVKLREGINRAYRIVELNGSQFPPPRSSVRKGNQQESGGPDAVGEEQFTCLRQSNY